MSGLPTRANYGVVCIDSTTSDLIFAQFKFDVSIRVTGDGGGARYVHAWLNGFAEPWKLLFECNFNYSNTYVQPQATPGTVHAINSTNFLLYFADQTIPAPFSPPLDETKFEFFIDRLDCPPPDLSVVVASPDYTVYNTENENLLDNFISGYVPSQDTPDNVTRGPIMSIADMKTFFDLP